MKTKNDESFWKTSIMSEVEAQQKDLKVKAEEYEDLAQMVRDMVKHLDRTGNGYHVTISVRAWFDLDQASKKTDELG